MGIPPERCRFLCRVSHHRNLKYKPGFLWGAWLDFLKVAFIEGDYPGLVGGENPAEIDTEFVFDSNEEEGLARPG